jgi:imidazole glycerol-phosphate synthase subunit HisH
VIGIIDYGMGNLSSVANALDHLEIPNRLLESPNQMVECDRVILPGVGAFGRAMENLHAGGWVDVVRGWAGEGKPLLGICLGMQLLVDESTEFGLTKGLGLISGRVDLMTPEDLVVPHMGWNSLSVLQPHPVLAGVNQGDDVYFVHSFALQDNRDCWLATADYGGEVPAVIGKGSVVGTQFHPEKSLAPGLAILQAFSEWDGVWEG